MAIMWSWQLSNKNHYIQQFEKIESLPSWRVRRVDQTWYKQRFEWKIDFDFAVESDRRRYGVDNRWLQLLRECEINNFNYRRRREVWCTFYTSDSNLLDHILAREEYKTAIYSIDYANDRYLIERENQVTLDSITDIKFVSHLQTEFRYQVFLGNFEWGKDDYKKTLTEYLAANSEEFLFKGYYQEIIHRCKHNTDIVDQFGRYRGVYDGFNFYAKSTEDILMLHMIAPGKVRKIIKIMERN